MIGDSRHFSIKELWKFRAFFLASHIAFITCFLLSIFWNPHSLKERFDTSHYFYINRGYPKAWAGVSVQDKKVDFPVIKAPLQSRNFEGNSIVKIIDLSTLFPYFATVFLIAYVMFWPVIASTDEHKAFFIGVFPLYIILPLLSFFMYFVWFPRI